MSKRRLSKQQHSRIQNRVLGDSSADEIADGDLVGVVVSHHGKTIEILPGELFACAEENRAVSTTTLRAHLRANLPLLVCGDRVIYRHEDNSNDIVIVEKIRHRENLLARPRPFTAPKPVAANIDLVVLVISVAPEPIRSLIDRYLIAAELINVEIAIAINKVDLLDSQATAKDSLLVDELRDIAATYRALDYPVYSLTTTSTAPRLPPDSALGQPFESLIEKMSNKTSILVGQSGVGKSSIINFFADRDIAAIGNISDSNSKGKHTTTNSTLHILSCAAREAASTNNPGSHHYMAVIDSPGIREFGLWHLSEDNVINGMREFRALSTQCQFRDCDHSRSKGCAVVAAIENGEIHSSRVASYRTILKSLEET